MKRYVPVLFSMILAGGLAGCGDTSSFFGGADAATDGGGGGEADMAMVHLFRLPPGIYKVTNLTVGNDACNFNPNDPMNPIVGALFALQNDGMGNIKLGNPNDMNTQPGADVGNPPQPAQGASCPGGAANPSQCASEPNAMAFNNNMGTLVRDNGVTSDMCMFHRHVVNQVTLTADGVFTADFSDTDSNHMNCMTQTMDCTTTWSWQFEFQNAFM